MNASVAGLPVLLRQLLSLQDAGITEVEVDSSIPDGIRNDPRLTLRLLPSETAPSRPAPSLNSSLRSKQLRAGSEPPSLAARVGLVWHPSLPRRLARADNAVDLEQVPLEPAEFVVPAGTPDERRRAERLLLGTLFKPTDGIISRKLNRHLSLRVTSWLLGTSVTPNQMTVVAFGFGLAAIAVVLRYGSAGFIPGAVLLQIQSILDGCDGEISRLKYLRSRMGEWLDQVFDDVINLGYFVAVGYLLYRTGSSLAGWVTLVGGVSHLVYQVALYAALITRGGGSGSVTSIRWWGQKAGDSAATSSANGGIRARATDLIEMGARRDFFTFLYLPGALLRLDLVAVFWSAVIFTVSGVTTASQWLVAGGPERAGEAARAGGAGRREGGKPG